MAFLLGHNIESQETLSFTPLLRYDARRAWAPGGRAGAAWCEESKRRMHTLDQNTVAAGKWADPLVANDNP